MRNFISRLLAALLLVSQPLHAEGPLQSARYFQNNGGLVDHISPLLIPEKNASAIQNITLDDRGQLTKRNGYSILNTTGTLGPTSWAVTGGGYHNAASGTSFFAVVVGTDVYRTSNSFGGSYTRVTGTASLTNSASNLVQTTSLQDKLVFCNESDKPFTLTASGNATQISTNTISAAKTCSTYGNYLVLANTTESSTSYPSRVRWSDVNDTESLPPNNYIDVEPNDGDMIVAMLSFEDSVYIFKRRSIHRMLITGQAGADAFVIRPVARNIGAWAKNSVVAIPNVGIAFLAQGTAYLFNGESLEPIGDPIQRTFDGISRAMWTRAVGAIYPKRFQYWLSVSDNGSTNNKVLVYDYVQKAWTVYAGIAANALASAETSAGDSILLSGDYYGNHYKQDTGTSDYPQGISTAIDAYYTTGDLTVGSPEITKNFKYLYVFSQVDSSTTVTINGYYDYDASAVAHTNSLSLSQVGAVYDTAIYDTDVYPNLQYKVSRIELNRSAKAIKLKFSNSSTGSLVGIIGWTLVFQMEDYRQ